MASVASRADRTVWRGERTGLGRGVKDDSPTVGSADPGACFPAETHCRAGSSGTGSLRSARRLRCCRVFPAGLSRASCPPSLSAAPPSSARVRPTRAPSFPCFSHKCALVSSQLMCVYIFRVIEVLRLWPWKHVGASAESGQGLCRREHSETPRVLGLRVARRGMGVRLGDRRGTYGRARARALPPLILRGAGTNALPKAGGQVAEPPFRPRCEGWHPAERALAFWFSALPSGACPGGCAAWGGKRGD